MMKKGVCLTAIFPEAMFDKSKLFEALEKVAATNLYNGVEYYFEGTDADYKAVRDKVKELGFYSVFLAGYPMKMEKIDISAKDEKVREKSVVSVQGLIKRAMRLGCDKVLILSGPVWEEFNQELLVEQFIKSIREITDEQGYKVVPEISGEKNSTKSYETTMPEISLEFFNTTGEPYLAIGELETIKMLCDKLSNVNFGITYDFSHAAQLRFDIEATFKELLPWIHHVHIANSVSKIESSPLYGDKHPLFGVADEDLSLSEVYGFMRGFQKREYFKDVAICSMEMISRDDHSPDWYFEQTLKQAKILLN